MLGLRGFAGLLIAALLIAARLSLLSFSTLFTLIGIVPLRLSFLLLTLIEQPLHQVAVVARISVIGHLRQCTVIGGERVVQLPESGQCIAAVVVAFGPCRPCRDCTACA